MLGAGLLSFAPMPVSASPHQMNSVLLCCFGRNTFFSADFPVGEAAPGDCEMLAAVCKVHSVIKVATAREPNEAAAESKRLRPHAGTKALGCIVALCEQVVCGPSCCSGYRCLVPCFMPI